MVHDQQRLSGSGARAAGEFVPARRLDFLLEGLSRVLAGFEFLHACCLKGFAFCEKGEYFITRLHDERLHRLGLRAFRRLCEKWLEGFHRLAKPAYDAVRTF